MKTLRIARASGPYVLPLLIILAGLQAMVGRPSLAQERVEPAGSWDSLMELGNARYQEGDFPGALETYETISEAGLESPDLHYNLGNVHFKLGQLGRSILSYERALVMDPGDPDIRANLDLARSLTADEIEPLPRFWVLSVISWWTNLLPRRILILTVFIVHVLTAAGFCTRILSRYSTSARVGTWLLVGGGLGLVLFGFTLLGREGVFGNAHWGIIMVEEVSVRSAPAEEDDLTLFRVHEGTKVRLDQRTDIWSEIVLEDGRVGWVPSEALETI